MKKARTSVQEKEVLPLPEKLLDVEGVQHILGVSRTRVFQLIKQNGLPHMKWKRTLRFHPHALARWLSEQQQQH